MKETITYRGDKMETVLNVNAVNQLEKGTCFYMESQTVDTICLILKGRVLIKNSGMQITAGSGSFLGICDLYAGKYQASYMALDNLVLYAFPAKSADDLSVILSANKEYRGLAVASQSKMIREIDKIYTALLKSAEELHGFLMASYRKYRHIGEQTGYQTLPVPLIEELEAFSHETGVAGELLAYYVECAAMPLEIQKPYYAFGSGICLKHIGEQGDIITQLMIECTELACYICELFQGLYHEEEPCLMIGIANLAKDINRIGGKNNDLIDMLDVVIDKINVTERLLLDKAGFDMRVNRTLLEETYFELLSGTGQSEKSEELVLDDNGDDIEEIKMELKDSLKKILEYSGLPDEITDEFESQLIAFGAIKDLISSDEKARALCRSLTGMYYQIYEAVFLKAYKEKDKTRMIDMFLNFGYLDERLLTDSQLAELYHLNTDPEEDGPCRVYFIREWLTKIYEKEKEPSKTEFDMDFAEFVRDKARKEKLTDEEIRHYQEDPLFRLEHEIKNMFTYNNRSISGRMGGFVPFLYSELFMRSIHKQILTARDINAAVNRLRLVDYSVFYRERVFSDVENGINKEYIAEEVFPDIILLPVPGSNGIMWQEITGKKRNTSGRFLFPVFMDVPMEDIMAAVLGRFRWELCRTIQGSAWNNIKYPSLTSEYSDYIQFYRKNRDLSEEKKEKLKMQIQKARGSLREVFVADYLIWVKFEAFGSLRLNKVVRGIMATYCPFAKALREKVENQPLFAEAMEKYKREKNKKIKELELRFRALEKENVTIPVEVIDTLAFYRET